MNLDIILVGELRGLEEISKGIICLYCNFFIDIAYSNFWCFPTFFRI